ncbi:MAG TPA: DNA polymerase IV [Candidatus Nitrosopolaris sp.]|nr:DNA polymerase IV [Candidatus Nitrosopolaris sp.]
MKYYVGCSGWGQNQTWAKDFYPDTLTTEGYVTYYSRIFDFVEVDLNNMVSRPTFIKWANQTPDNFRFTLRIPQAIIQSTDTESLGHFLEHDLDPLEDKVLALVVQPSSTVKLNDGREWLDEVLRICAYYGYQVVMEFNHYSWFQDLTYHILEKYSSALAWTEKSRPVITSDFLYLRISDNKASVIKKWIQKMNQEKEETKKGNELDYIIIVVDRPATVDTVLRLLNLPERKNDDQNYWTGRVITCVDLNAFYPSCEELRDPSLIGKPHAAIMTDQQEANNITKGVVASASYEARKLGVKSAMPLSKARELCPSLILKPVDIPYYRQVSDKVMSMLEGYADVLEQTSIDEAYLDCTKKVVVKYNQSHYSNIERYALDIKKTIEEQCNLRSSIGVAPTKSAAKMASDFQKPDGLTIFYPNQLQKFLEDLEVERISGIGAKTQQVLKEQMGIHTIGQLAKYDVQNLMDRFGKKNGLWMWQVANGQDESQVIPREDHISLSTERTLESFTKDKKVILQFLLNELVDELYERVSKHEYRFKTVAVKIVRSDFSVETRETSYSNYQTRKESIAYVTEGLLDRFSFDDNTAKIRKVGLKVSKLVRSANKKPSALKQKTLLDYC